MLNHILTIMIAVPFIGGIAIFAFASWSPQMVRRVAMGTALITFVLALVALGKFDAHRADLANNGVLLVESYTLDSGSELPVILQYKLGVNGISMPLVLLAALLTPLAIWASFTGIKTREREYYALMLLLFGTMLGVFCARDLLLFYVFFEFTLIPLYFLIGVWGGSERRKAANMFFIYTLSGSMLTFAGVLYVGWKASQLTGGVMAFDFETLLQLAEQGLLTAGEQWWLFLAFFAGFAIKVPLFPFHTWLPLAHVEAPTAGSVILAAVLLKLGTYGFLVICMPFFPAGAMQWAPFVGVLAVVGIIYGALAAWVQEDVKRLVAYSSVSHLGYCLLGMFCLKMAGMTGSVLYMVNHGLSTGALFLIIGMIYERYHTRDMAKIGGLARKMPIMASFLIFFTMSSIGLPGLNGFVSEFMVLLGTFISSAPDAVATQGGPYGIWYAVFGASGILLGAIYMLFMARRVLFGKLTEPDGGFDDSAGLTQDLTQREVGILIPLALACVYLGVYPKPMMDMMEPSLQPILASVARVDRTQFDGQRRATPGRAVALDSPTLARVMDGAPDAAVGRTVAATEMFLSPARAESLHRGFTTPQDRRDGIVHAGYRRLGQTTRNSSNADALALKEAR